MIPFRSRQAAGRLFSSLLVFLLVLAIAIVCWGLWLNRYIVYTRSGAVLDFGIDLSFPEAKPADPPAPGPTVDIYYNEGDNAITPVTSELKQLTGYHVTEAMLQGDIAAISRQIQLLPSGTPIMLDVKNIRGDFLYNSSQGYQSENVDRDALEAMIATLRSKGYYLIARLPAFRDYRYGLANVNDGLFNLNQMSLWMDADRCYWLNPERDGTLTYLLQIIAEIKNLGFDEVVFYDFRFPDTDKIYFTGDKAAAIENIASVLVKTCATEKFAVSFVSTVANFPLPEGRTRLYFQGIAAADAANLAGQTGVDNPAVKLVFLTDLMDTRFDSYGVLRPLPMEG
ncbi:MAG: hypothetical protein E7448_06860 [Ruminococcaceae bacterium]|nr:hypothetical protein [Oscillospiraceae bacterium]